MGMPPEKRVRARVQRPASSQYVTMGGTKTGAGPRLIAGLTEKLMVLRRSELGLADAFLILAVLVGFAGSIKTGVLVPMFVTAG